MCFGSISNQIMIFLQNFINDSNNNSFIFFSYIFLIYQIQWFKFISIMIKNE